MILEDQHGSSILQGIASILSAVLWPLLVAILLFCYRKTIAAVVPIFVDKLRNATSVEVPGLKFEQAKEVIREAVEDAPTETVTDGVPKSQIRGAESLEKQLGSVGVTAEDTASLIEGEVVTLGREYDEVRASMPRGPERTQKMNIVMGKMRTLGIRMVPLIPRMATSRRAGERLAAIAALQIQPDPRYLGWLLERFSVEQPFLFFHASLAISEYVQKFGMPSTLSEEVQRARDHIAAHQAPDMNTLRVLDGLLA